MSELKIVTIVFMVAVLGMLNPRAAFGTVAGFSIGHAIILWAGL